MRLRLPLLVRFAVLSMSAFVLLGLALAQVLSGIVQGEARRGAERSAALMASAVARYDLVPANFTLGLRPDQRDALADIVQGGAVEGVVLWAPDGLVVHDSRGSRTGERYPITANLRAAAAGRVVSQLEPGWLLEVYVPIELEGEVRGVFEAYLPYAATAQRAEAATTRLQLVLALGLGVLWLLLYRLVATASRRLEKQSRDNEHLALHDPLTGLANRTLLVRELSAATARPEGTTGLLLLDLDGFKEINDTLGHASGDRLLVDVAHRLVAAVGSSGLVARLGGDEFAIVLPGVAGEAQACTIAERLRRGLEETVVVEGVVLSARASFGVALSPQHGTSAEELLQRADVAMYVAKRTHGRVTVYSAEHDDHSADRLGLMADLQAALHAGDVYLEYQPLVRIADGRVVSVEALARWTCPTRGRVPPDVFVPVAERTGLIGALTHTVLELALAQARAWRDAGLVLPVSVNASARSVLDDSFPDLVLAALRRHGLPPEALEIEVTESVAVSDPDRAVEVLSRLRNAGVRIAIDDFGTGYTCLAHLRRLPVDILKIDRTFVTSLGSAAGDAAVVRSILDLAHVLGLSVVAEGVEDAPTLALLADLGCDVVQGWHFARSMPADQVSGWVAERALSTGVPAPRPGAPAVQQSV